MLFRGDGRGSGGLVCARDERGNKSTDRCIRSHGSDSVRLQTWGGFRAMASLAQDFWVYFSRKEGLGLDYLRLLFDRGADPEAGGAFFRGLNQTSLADEYWGWVKGQAMERTIDLDATTRTAAMSTLPHDLR